MKTIGKPSVIHKDHPRAGFSGGMVMLIVAVAVAVLAVALKASSIVAADTLPPPSPTQAASQKALFAMTIPSQPDKKQVLEVKPTESIFLSVAMVKSEVPLANWTEVGWKTGNAIGEADTVPVDCALHSRLGIARQVYAACQGPNQIAIPPAGGDFVYVVFTGADQRVARVLRTGALYNPDTSGLIP